MTGNDELRFARQRQWSDPATLRRGGGACPTGRPVPGGEAENRGLHLLNRLLKAFVITLGLIRTRNGARAYSDFLGLGQGHCRAD
jgi:hypothetical protein